MIMYWFRNYAPGILACFLVYILAQVLGFLWHFDIWAVSGLYSTLLVMGTLALLIVRRVVMFFEMRRFMKRFPDYADYIAFPEIRE